MRYRAMGRLYVPDERDRAFPLSTMLRTTERRKRHWWDDGYWGDQGYDPHCVAFAHAHWLADGPTPASIFAARRPGVDTRALYCEAQKHDPWPGDCETAPHYDGTSVRAGAKVMQAWGYVQEYRWAYTASEVAQAILTLGPVVVGTTWYSGMSSPDANGVMHPTGYVEGGHAYVLNGVDLDTGLVRAKNSWGRGWSKSGRAYLSLADLDKLLADYGECCVPISPSATRLPPADEPRDDPLA